MIIRTFFIVVILLTTIQGSELKTKAEQTLVNFYAQKVSLDFQKYSIPPKLKSRIENEVKQKFFRPEVYFWKIKISKDSINYAILDNSMGKSLPITFLVIFDEKGKVIHSSIVKYREPIGGAISSESWNKQFEGKSAKSSYRVGQDINGISGATISVYAVTKGIHKLSLLIKGIIESE